MRAGGKRATEYPTEMARDRENCKCTFAQGVLNLSAFCGRYRSPFRNVASLPSDSGRNGKASVEMSDPNRMIGSSERSFREFEQDADAPSIFPLSPCYDMFILFPLQANPQQKCTTELNGNSTDRQ